MGNPQDAKEASMSRLFYVVLLIVAVIGGLYLYTHYEIVGWNQMNIQPRLPGSSGFWSGSNSSANSLTGSRAYLRMGTFNFGPLDHRKLSQQHVTARLIELIRQFDLLAVQNIQAPNQGLLVELLERVNSGGFQYDFAVSEQVARGPVDQYGAILFNRATVQIDRNTVYQVRDPGGLLRRPPLVGSFQARGPDPTEAFTFTVINVHTDANLAVAELDVLDDVFRAVRKNQPAEDDVLLLGDLGTNNQYLGQLGQIPLITRAFASEPDDMQDSSPPTANVLFDRRATTEFTGRSGVTSLEREFHLSMREAVEISAHSPVWGKFSVYEGGQAGHVAFDLREATQSGETR